MPVFGVEDELRACLDSILTQSFTDIEVIAVDDHSQDRSGAILDEYAGRDPRVRVIHLDRSGGPGNARNAGLDLAPVTTSGSSTQTTCSLTRAWPRSVRSWPAPIRTSCSSDSPACSHRVPSNRTPGGICSASTSPGRCSRSRTGQR